MTRGRRRASPRSSHSASPRTLRKCKPRSESSFGVMQRVEAKCPSLRLSRKRWVVENETSSTPRCREQVRPRQPNESQRHEQKPEIGNEVEQVVEPAMRINRQPKVAASSGFSIAGAAPSSAPAQAPPPHLDSEPESSHPTGLAGGSKQTVPHDHFHRGADPR